MSHIGSMSSSARGGHIFHLPLSPILVLHIVSQHNPSNPTAGWKPVFKYVAFDLACDRTNNESRCLPIVFFCRQNKWRPPPRLFKPRFWGEVHPDDIPASWDVCLLLSYHSSSNGRCLEFGNIRQTLRGDLLQHGMDIHLQHVLWFHDRAQDDRPLRCDFKIDKVSEERPAVFRMTEGMRTPALFPHLVTVIDMASICDG